jgi:hypothetical protein
MSPERGWGRPAHHRGGVGLRLHTRCPRSTSPQSRGRTTSPARGRSEGRDPRNASLAVRDRFSRRSRASSRTRLSRCVSEISTRPSPNCSQRLSPIRRSKTLSRLTAIPPNAGSGALAAAATRCRSSPRSAPRGRSRVGGDPAPSSSEYRSQTRNPSDPPCVCWRLRTIPRVLQMG